MTTAAKPQSKAAAKRASLAAWLAEYNRATIASGLVGRPLAKVQS